MARPAVLLVVLARDFEGHLVCLGTGVGEEKDVIVLEPLAKFLPQSDSRLVALEQRVVR
jgi:hypothetical protein